MIDGLDINDLSVIVPLPMAKAEMFPALKTLVDQLAGSYPLDPQNEIFRRFIAEWEPRKIGALFKNTFALFRETVDVEHELSLQTKTFGSHPLISPETVQLGHIADALLHRLNEAGVKMSFAVRSIAVEAHLSQESYHRNTIHRYSSDSSGYYRFYTNEDWLDGKPAIHLGFIGDSSDVFLRNRLGTFAVFDIRDVYLVGIRY